MTPRAARTRSPTRSRRSILAAFPQRGGDHPPGPGRARRGARATFSPGARDGMTSTQRDIIAFLSRPADPWPARRSSGSTRTAPSSFSPASAPTSSSARSSSPYLDFSTVERRRRACEAELRVNRRTAPTLYRRVVPVTRGAATALELGGTGRSVDWLVVMRRFDQDHAVRSPRRARRADAGAWRALARRIARFHAAGGAAARSRRRRAASPGIIDGNSNGLAEAAPGVLAADDARAVEARVPRGVRAAGATLLDAARAAGCVRRCHGDLHLRNICLIDGRADAVRRDRVQRRASPPSTCCSISPSC